MSEEVQQDTTPVTETPVTETPVTETPVVSTPETPVLDIIDVPASSTKSVEIEFGGKKIVTHSTGLVYPVIFDDGSEGYVPKAIIDGE